jgi:broad specificity phosphatase PhoE
MGRQPEEVRADPRLAGLKRFGSLQWDDNAIQGEWWRIGGDRERYQSFLTAVANTPHERIVVVCHWGFINQLMAACGANVSLQNCQWARTEWS